MCQVRREFKAKNEHWQIILNYFETYPQMIKKKFDMFDGDASEIKKMWEKLSEHLNSLGYGQKTAEKWQLAIGRWKSKVKAATLRLEMEKTGGGPVKSPPLTELEERLMAILGWKAITGDRNKEFGIEKYKSTSIEIEQEATHKQTDVESQPEPLPCISGTVPLLHFFDKCGGVENEDTGPQRKRTTPPPSTKRKINLTTERSRKMDSLNHMHKEQLSVLKNIEIGVTNLSQSIVEIKNDFREYIHIMKSRENLLKKKVVKIRSVIFK